MPIVEAITKAVGVSLGGVTVDEVCSKSRLKTVSLARMISAYVVREKVELSYPELGRQFCRDHTTLIWGHSRVSDLIASGDGRAIAAVEAGVAAADNWRPDVLVMAGESREASLRQRRRELTRDLSEKIEEARQIDAELAGKPR